MPGLQGSLSRPRKRLTPVLKYGLQMGIRFVADFEATTLDTDFQAFQEPGPRGGGCDVLYREVAREDLEEYEILHEVMHVVLAMPFIPLEYQPIEADFLIPIEREYARVLLSKKSFKEAVEWQEITAAGPYAGELGQIPNYDKTPAWRRALRMGRQLGVLSEQNEPVFRWPDWNALSIANRKYLYASNN